jgi:D-alanyl-D-alanine carboxypeptidase
MKIVKFILLVFSVAGLLLVSQSTYARHAALLIDADNGDVLYELEANQSWYPASLTKLMTLYMTFSALESGRLRLSDRLSVSSHAAHQPTSKLGLRAWSSISVEDAVLAVVTRSANDAAVVLAERLGGTENRFAASMTSTAHSLGMYGSHFMNATGLPHDWQTTTAHDMALLGYKLIRNFPQYYPYFRVDSFYFNDRYLPSSNKFVLNYPGAEGMKTGYTCGSGYNLVATANLAGKRLVGVVLGGHTSSERYQQMFTMMDIGFSNEGGYRARNINTMSPSSVGTPPYQLSCGNRPSSHYASKHHHTEDDDNMAVRYVKKSMTPKRHYVAAHHVEPRRTAREITKVRIAGKTKTIVKTTSAQKLAAKTSKHSHTESKTASRTSKSTKTIAKGKTTTKSKSPKATQTAKAGKGYFVPGKDKKSGKSTAASKSKGYYKPDKTSKTVASAAGKNKKSAKKKS